MPKKIAHQPGYELKKNPETGVYRWHAVEKKKINPETGEVYTEPALFEELPDPDPEEFWAAKQYLTHRGIEFVDTPHDGVVVVLPEPEDVAGTVDPHVFLDHMIEMGKRSYLRLPETLDEWLDETGIIDEVDGIDGGDEAVAKQFIKAAVETGGSGFGAIARRIIDDDDKLEDLLREMYTKGEFSFLKDTHPSDPDAIKKLDNALEEAFGFGFSDGILDNMLNDPEKNILDDYGYWDRVHDFHETRNKIKEELPRVLGTSGFDEAVEAIRNDPKTFEQWDKHLVKVVKDKRIQSEVDDSDYDESILRIVERHQQMAGADDREAREAAKSIQEKYAEYLKGIHERPALSTNRLPGTTADMLRNTGEYMWREADGPSDSRIEMEAAHALGRVGYAALAYEGAAPLPDGSGRPVRLDPNTLPLGTGDWGEVRLLWTPPELTDPDGEGLSYAFDDFWFNSAHGSDGPFWLSAALSGLNHSARGLLGYSDTLRSGISPNFTEMHFRRPLTVEGDLAEIYVPVNGVEHGVSPNEAADKIVYNQFVRDNYGNIFAEDTPKHVGLYLQPKRWGEDRGDQYVADVIGETAELLNHEFGGKVKLWIPRSLKK